MLRMALRTCQMHFSGVEQNRGCKFVLNRNSAPTKLVSLPRQWGEFTASSHRHQLKSELIFSKKEVLPQSLVSDKQCLEEGASDGDSSQGRRLDATLVW